MTGKPRQMRERGGQERPTASKCQWEADQQLLGLRWRRWWTSWIEEASPCLRCRCHRHHLRCLHSDEELSLLLLAEGPTLLPLRYSEALD